MDKDEIVKVYRLDLQKAFDPKSVRAFGVDVEVKDWMAQSLQGGSFNVWVEGHLPDMGLLCSGGRPRITALPDVGQGHNQRVWGSVSYVCR